MEEVLNTISQAEALEKGKEYWENVYADMLRNRDSAIMSIMRDMKGMEADDVLEDFATLQVDSFIRAMRSWIDETFPKKTLL